jgi:16S rRNA (guanine527-N7)-methyltransferase
MQKAMELLRRQADALAVELSDQSVSQIEKFISLIASYNEHTNLVADSDAEVLVQNHIVDSLSLIPLICFGAGPASLVDIGSGAGFPGMILAMACPQLDVMLVDSIGKKTKFLQMVAEDLSLSERVTVVNERAEVLARNRQLRESFDLATARAVGPIDMVAELALPLLKDGGKLLAQKSQAQLEDEERRAGKSLPKLGAELESVVNLDQTVLGKNLVVMTIKKLKATASCYPRTPAQMRKQPLGD